MNESPDDERRTLVSWFFKYVAWPALRHVLNDLFSPGDMIRIRGVLETSFIDITNQAINDAESTGNNLAGLIDGDKILVSAPEWIKKMLVSVLDEFISTIARYFKSTTPENEDLTEYVENAMILYLFDAVFWKFPHDMLIMHSHLPVSSLAEIKEKLLEQLRRYLDGDITLKEAKRAAAAILEMIDLDNDIVHEIIASYVANFYEIIQGLDPQRLHAFMEDFTRTRGSFLSRDLTPDVDESSKNAVFCWFEQDIVTTSMKSIAELYPELTHDEIAAWKIAITKDLDLVLQGLLSFDDFEKRLLARLKLPKLEFDIEKPVEEAEVEDHFMHIDDRGGALETILSSAELIYQEALKDPSLKDLATRIESRKKSLDNMYM